MFFIKASAGKKISCLHYRFIELKYLKKSKDCYDFDAAVAFFFSLLATDFE